MSTPYRVLVTGSRTWPHPGWVCLALGQHLAALPPDVTLTVVHGGAARGADLSASGWCARAAAEGWPVQQEQHPADWLAHGKAAGPRRNARMVELGAEVCLAFIAECPKPACRRPRPHGSHGAMHCAQLAERAGIPVRRWTA